MPFKIKLSFLFVALSVFFTCSSQNNKVYSSLSSSKGVVEEIIVSGHDANLCLAIEFIKHLSKGKKNLVIYMPRYNIDDKDSCYMAIMENWTDSLKGVKTDREVWKEEIADNTQFNYLKNSQYSTVSFSSYKKNSSDYVLFSYLKNTLNLSEKIKVVFFDIKVSDNVEFVQDVGVSSRVEDNSMQLLLATKHKEWIKRKNIITSISANRSTNRSPFVLKELNYDFDGGNVLIGNDIAYIGKDFLRDNCIGGIDLKDDFGVNKVLFVGLDEPVPNSFHKNILSYQPHYHIDLFMNVIEQGSKNIILWSKFMQMDEEQLSEKEMKWNSQIREIEKDLKESMPVIGISIKFDSIPLYFGNDFYLGEFVYSYSNSLIEYNAIDSSGIAYLPFYHDIDTSFYHNYIDSVYEKYGIVTQYISNGNQKGFNEYKEEGASLHCLIKVLSRED